ncbi:MAG: DUF4440 domain-containing protein [Gemmatimonadales bacterium]
MNRPAVVLSGIGVIVLVALSPWRTAGGQAAPLAAKTQVQPSIVDEVWAMEDSYWRYVKAADVEKYLTLWNKDFRGWPCADEHPATKANIGDWVRDIRDKKVRFTSALSKEGATSVGGVVVVYYRTSMNYEYPDRHKESVGKPVKITHTWMKVNGRWEIIGGMCGADAPRK